MELNLLIANWSGRLPLGFVRSAPIPQTSETRCSQPRCKGTVAIKRDGTPAKSLVEP